MEGRKDKRKGSVLQGQGAGSLTASSGGATTGLSRSPFNVQASQTQRNLGRAALSPHVQTQGRQGTLGAQLRVWKRRDLPFEESADILHCVSWSCRPGCPAQSAAWPAKSVRGPEPTAGPRPGKTLPHPGREALLPRVLPRSFPGPADPVAARAFEHGLPSKSGVAGTLPLPALPAAGLAPRKREDWDAPAPPLSACCAQGRCWDTKSTPHPARSFSDPCLWCERAQVSILVITVL